MVQSSIDALINKINRSIIGGKEIRRVVRVMRRGLLSRPEGGPEVKQLQRQMAAMHGQIFGISSTSGTSALHLAIGALQLKKGDEVIVPALANIADCSVIIQEGGVPVFADINSRSFCIDPNDIERRITQKTKAVIVVHMYGQPADLGRISTLCKRNKLVLIEDCAQAAGAVYKKKLVGSYGDLSCFSLYQTKHIICGEGGMVLCRKRIYFERMSSLANNGIMRDDLDAYDYDRIGYNYQLTEIQAAIAIEQLKKLARANVIRRRHARIFRKSLGNEIQFQEELPRTLHAYFYLTGLLPKQFSGKKRDLFIGLVKKFGVPIKKLYPLVLPQVHLLKGRVNADVPVAKDVASRLFNLYVNPGLSEGDIARAAIAVKKAFIRIARGA